MHFFCEHKLGEMLSFPQPSVFTEMAEELLQFETFTVIKVLEKSSDIVKSSPKIFRLISLTFILPLSVAILARSLFTTMPLFSYIPVQFFDDSDHKWDRKWTQFFLFEVLYPTIIFAFSLVSTAATVFTVASIYTSRPVSFSTTLSAVPRVFKRLFITFFFFSFFLILSNVAVMLFLILLSGFLDPYDHEYLYIFLLLVFYSLIFFPSSVYITALWHVASVVSVLEPVYGLEAMKRSKVLLKGRTAIALEFVTVYLGIYIEIEVVCSLAREMFVMVLCVVALLILNLVGLLVQSVFYFMCKSYHQEEIDKGALFEHLGSYVGEYVPVNCSIEMQEV